ncbi:MAG: HAD family hydrolase, partial [Candidatus Eisenbacteria bacterium]
MSEAHPPLVWLFDVDGTLIVTDGAAREAFSLGFRDTTGTADDMSRVAFGGRTDPLILDELLALHGLVWDEPTRARFWRATHAHMESLLAKGRGRVLPGVLATLDALDAEPAWTPALLTGNSAEMARIKLGHYRLAGRFRFGAFGN